MNPAPRSGPSDPPDLLRISSMRPAPGLVVLEAGGEVDMNTSPLLRNELTTIIRSRPATLVVDLAAVDFFGSPGIHALMLLYRQCAEDGIHLRLVASRSVRRVLEIVGVNETFALFDSRDNAIADRT